MLASTGLERDNTYEELRQGQAWREISINVSNNGGDSGGGDDKGLASRRVVLQHYNMAFFR